MAEDTKVNSVKKTDDSAARISQLESDVNALANALNKHIALFNRHIKDLHIDGDSNSHQ